jgi:hypothetical protein
VSAVASAELAPAWVLRRVQGEQRFSVPLARVVGSVLPSGADVSAGAAVVTTYSEPPAEVDLGHPAGAEARRRRVVVFYAQRR